MSDLTDLSDHTRFLPPPDGLAVTVVRARRLRLRRRGLQTLAGAVVVASGAALLSGTSGSGRDTLIPAHSPTPQVSDSPSASPAAADQSLVGVVAAKGGVASPRALVLASPQASPTPGASRPRSTSPWGPVRSQYVQGGTPASCTGVPSATVAGHRVGSSSSCGSAIGLGGRPRLVLGLDYCRAKAATAVTMSFATRQETTWRVRGKGGSWTWRAPTDEGARHDLTVAAGDCITWRTDWAGVDDTGHQLPPGNYTLTVGLTARDFAGTYTATVTL